MIGTREGSLLNFFGRGAGFGILDSGRDSVSERFNGGGVEEALAAPELLPLLAPRVL